MCSSDLTTPFWRNQVRVVCSYAAAPRDLAEAIGLLRSGRISVREMITHRLPLEKAQEGFLLTAEPKESLKVVLAPHG